MIHATRFGLWLIAWRGCISAVKASYQRERIMGLVVSEWMALATRMLGIHIGNALDLEVNPQSGLGDLALGGWPLNQVSQRITGLEGEHLVAPPVGEHGADVEISVAGLFEA